jgi:hypothetical protein
MIKHILDKYFARTKGNYPFFKYCPKQYIDYYVNKKASNILGYEYNYRTPKTLNEKIRWLIFNENLELKTKLTDKISVKGYVASKLGCNHSAEIYGIYNNFKEIDFSILPNEIAIKANHGWRMNVISKNKNFIFSNFKDINYITNKWLKTNFEEFNVEPQYKNIKRKLFVEFLRSNNYRNEIQVYCFNGKPVFCELPIKIGNNIFFQIYDTSWVLQKFTHSNIFYEEKQEIPYKLDDILEYSKILSNGFSFVRIDFAYNDKDIHVVEMTFTPFGAAIPFDNIETDYYLGDMLELPERGVVNA